MQEAEMAETADHDIYSKLRLPEPTPESELCVCAGSPPIKLMFALSPNPMHCMNCNLEVRPETFELTPELITAMAYWTWVYEAIYRLWLDSQEYEDWAEEQLSDIFSPVNVRGRVVQGELTQVRRCYYWFFQDRSADDYRPIKDCPSCGRPLLAYTEGIFLQMICDNCGIVVVGD
jgi:predicted  nucleic acid-binding Zn ribbon protein